MPEEEHGDERNITLSELESAASAAGITLDEVVQNIDEGTAGARESEVPAR